MLETVGVDGKEHIRVDYVELVAVDVQNQESNSNSTSEVTDRLTGEALQEVESNSSTTQENPDKILLPNN